jgi:hypothetical protein
MIELPYINETPEEFRILLSETYINNNGEIIFTERTQHFQLLIRVYNNIITFTSLDIDIDRIIINNTHNVYSLRVRGEIYHRLGILLPHDDERAQYTQVYIYNDDEMIQTQ